jgi:hypothetical protein
MNFALLPKPIHKQNEWPWVASLAKPIDTTLSDILWPKISIITPSYNQGQFLEETIRSVLLQGYPNLEYIVMDGGSTDNSVDIIKKYEPWITYWQSKPDRGQSHAINQGFERATGDILAWLNSDDAYTPNTLPVVAQHLSNKQGALLVGSSIVTTSAYSLEGKLDTRKPSWREMIYEARSFPQPSVFWTRDLWDAAGGLDEKLYFAMDYDLWLRMYPQAKEVIFLEEALSFARSHSEQKGAKAKQIGKLNIFDVQRAYAGVQAAKQRNKTALFWLSLLWLHRAKSAIRSRNLSLLRGSSFHRAATHIVFKTQKFSEYE